MQYEHYNILRYKSFMYHISVTFIEFAGASAGEQFSVLLDTVLRSVAVLDPTSFEAAVRSQLAVILVGANKVRQVITKKGKKGKLPFVSMFHVAFLAPINFLHWFLHSHLPLTFVCSPNLTIFYRLYSGTQCCI